jgi:hypothetical protein
MIALDYFIGFYKNDIGPYAIELCSKLALYFKELINKVLKDDD